MIIYVLVIFCLLQHEHDFLIADEDKWRRLGHDKSSHRSPHHRSLASAMPLNNKLPPNLKSDHLNANRSPKTPLKATTNGVAGRSLAPGAPNSKHHRGPSFKSIKHNKGENMNFHTTSLGTINMILYQINPCITTTYSEVVFCNVRAVFTTFDLVRTFAGSKSSYL